ncbi:hypothetical protein FTO74_04150 [Granulicella sp. WH15]|uniref:hypothetical protein n=1 Tax=Granulicella sp. WH15 TaxID=2602070 RepID=UPI001367684A|nr:hypothetical protein [Granulicella sp. WH15]QHN02651.1 hypothetical protein FTO74_04150 [Granulicella sp. WH15]
MSKAAQDKSHPLTPRIVINACGVEDADAKLKGFIDDWFVPALVDHYIRRHRKPSAPMDRDTDCDSQKVESED